MYKPTARNFKFVLNRIFTVLSLLMVFGALALPEPVPVQAQSSCPPDISGWKGQYWSNTHWRSRVVECRDDAEINFDWGRGSPGMDIPSDNFSARWTRSLDLPGGRYRFYVAADDGVQLKMDGHVLINKLINQPVTLYYVDREVRDGRHSFEVNYFDRSGFAAVKFWYETPPGPDPVGVMEPPPGYRFCSPEYKYCAFDGFADVAFGANGQFAYRNGVGGGGVDCSVATFGDPVSNTAKACYIHSTDSGAPDLGGGQQPQPSNRQVQAPVLTYPYNGSTLSLWSTLSLSWNGSPGVAQFRAELWGDQYSLHTVCDWQSQTLCYLGQLDRSGWVFWHVKARDAAGHESNWSETYSFWVPPQATVSLPAVTLSNPGNGVLLGPTTSIELYWEPRSGVRSYQVELWDANNRQLSPCSSVTGTSCYIGGKPGGTYWWHVRYTDYNNQWSDWSDTWSFTVEDCPVGAHCPIP